MQACPIPVGLHAPARPAPLTPPLPGAAHL
jgi:hypothetical protein